MPQPRSRMIFLNLPVKDLDRSKSFFTALGFEFNPQFSDENAACMIISDQAFVMLLRDDYFRTFTMKGICDSTTHAEALVALSCESREEVDELADLALSSGGSHAMDPQDHGFMFVRSFNDPDGHHWELAWMDPSGFEQ